MKREPNRHGAMTWPNVVLGIGVELFYALALGGLTFLLAVIVARAL